MTAPFLALDSDHFAITGVWTLYNRPCGLSFTFGDPLALGAFLRHYYRNPLAAQFAYNATLERKHAK